MTTETNEVVTFHLSVDYSRTTEEMLWAGEYDWSNPNITEEHFPRPRTSGVVKGEYKPFHFNRNISSEDAVLEMGAGWEPAGPHEILVYGDKFPETQRKFPIVGLGEPVWRRRYGFRRVVVLGRVGSYYYANLSFWGGFWRPHYRFLVRRK